MRQFGLLMKLFPATSGLALSICLASCDPAPPGLGDAVPSAVTGQAGKRLLAGDVVPDFSFTGHDGKPRNLASLRPQAVLMTFIFTRCTMMEFCPRMSFKFQQTRAALDASPHKADVELLSITLDPEHDTPAALAEYAMSFGAGAGGWTFATCQPAVLELLKQRFGVQAAATGPNGSIEHNLITALVDGRGRVQMIWEGNAWTTADVIQQF